MNTITRKRFLATAAAALAAPFAALLTAKAVPAGREPTLKSTPAPTTGTFGPLQTHAYVNCESYVDEHGTECLDFTRADLHVDRFRHWHTDPVTDGRVTRYRHSMKRLNGRGGLVEIADFDLRINIPRSDGNYWPAKLDRVVMTIPSFTVTASWREPISTSLT
jgi:hypothetical protein